MYKIRPTLFGLRVTLSEYLDSNQAIKFQASLRRLFKKYPVPFAIIIDLRELIPPAPDVLEILKECMIFGRENMMEKLAIIYNSPVVKNQAQRLSFLSGAIKEAREIDASKHEDWEKIALNWIMNDVDPADQCNSTAKIKIPQNPDLIQN